MIEIPTGLPAELVPLSWLLGVWEGTGVLDYAIDNGAIDNGAIYAGARSEKHVQSEFGQRVSFSHDGLPYLNYSSYTWLISDGEPSDEPDDAVRPLVPETGYWRLSRPLTDGDPGPAMLPGVGARPFANAEAVETLRNASGGFDLEVSLVHPDSVAELYLGQITGPRIDLSTDTVIRSATAKEYAAATRLYGLVDAHLLWAWDIAALGQDLRTHASARLTKVD